MVMNSDLYSRQANAGLNAHQSLGQTSANQLSQLGRQYPAGIPYGYSSLLLPRGWREDAYREGKIKRMEEDLKLYLHRND
jgi:hypothetical protein